MVLLCGLVVWATLPNDSKRGIEGRDRRSQLRHDASAGADALAGCAHRTDVGDGDSRQADAGGSGSHADTDAPQRAAGARAPQHLLS